MSRLDRTWPVLLNRLRVRAEKRSCSAGPSKYTMRKSVLSVMRLASWAKQMAGQFFLGVMNWIKFLSGGGNNGIDITFFYSIAAKFWYIQQICPFI